MLPKEWKQANVILIPKPGKPLGLENMRPISLTSCVGKVAEHVILNRISGYIEEKNLFPHQMIGFRPHLSTQDAMLQIKKDIFDNPTRDTQAILAVDSEKAFDRVEHRHVLRTIAEMNLGVKFYKYVKAFLENRTCQLQVGDLCSDELRLGNRGTPQGSVLSPLLFNIAMRPISTSLGNLSKIHHTIYADDVTLWCTGGRDSDIEGNLQEAISLLETELQGTGLRCSPSKSELLLYRPIGRGRRSKKTLDPQDKNIVVLFEDGEAIPQVDRIRILGMIIEANGARGATVELLRTQAESTAKLLARIANRSTGVKEDGLLKIFQAFFF